MSYRYDQTLCDQEGADIMLWRRDLPYQFDSNELGAVLQPVSSEAKVRADARDSFHHPYIRSVTVFFTYGGLLRLYWGMNCWDGQILGVASDNLGGCDSYITSALRALSEYVERMEAP